MLVPFRTHLICGMAVVNLKLATISVKFFSVTWLSTFSTSKKKHEKVATVTVKVKSEIDGRTRTKTRHENVDSTESGEGCGGNWVKRRISANCLLFDLNTSIQH